MKTKGKTWTLIFIGNYDILVVVRHPRFKVKPLKKCNGRY